MKKIIILILIFLRLFSYSNDIEILGEKDLEDLLKYKTERKFINHTDEEKFFKNKNIILININTISIDKIAVTFEENGNHYLFLKKEKWSKYRNNKELFLKDFNKINFNFSNIVFFKNEFYSSNAT